MGQPGWWCNAALIVTECHHQDIYHPELLSLNEALFFGGGITLLFHNFANERLWMMMKSSSWRCHLATAGLCHEAVTTWPWSLLASLWCLYSAASEQPLPVLCYPQVTISCCQMSRPGSHNHLYCHGIMIRISMISNSRRLEAAHHMNNGQDTAAEDRGWAHGTGHSCCCRSATDSSCHKLSQLSSRLLLSQEELHFFSNNNRYTSSNDTLE